MARNPYELAAAFVDGNDIKDALALLPLIDCKTARAHPLGFVLFDVASAGISRIRLHVWPASERTLHHSLAQIHDHAFSFRSRCLAGQIANWQYTVESSAQGPYQMYEVAYDNSSSSLRLLDGHWTATRVDESCYEAGETYQMSAGVFHRSVVPNSMLTATLMVTEGMENAPSPKVLVSNETELSEKFTRATIENQISSQLLADLAAELRRFSSKGEDERDR